MSKAHFMILSLDTELKSCLLAIHQNLLANTRKGLVFDHCFKVSKCYNSTKHINTHYLHILYFRILPIVIHIIINIIYNNYIYKYNLMSLIY